MIRPMTTAEFDEVRLFWDEKVRAFVHARAQHLTVFEELCASSALEAILFGDEHALDVALEMMGTCARCGRAPFVCDGTSRCEPITLPSEAFLPDGAS